MKNIILLLTSFFLSTGLVAQSNPLPEGTKSLINYKKLRTLQYEKTNLGRISNNNAEKGHKITLTCETLTHPDKIYSLATRIPIWSKNVASEQIIFLSFQARTLEASLETDEAKVLWQLNVSDRPKDRQRSTISMSHVWQEYFVPFKVDKSIQAKNLRLTMQYGFPPQKFEIKKLRLHLLPEGTDMATLPKTQITYGGMEADAAWRKPAAERIEKHRKGNFTLHVTKKGKPVTDLPIQVKLKRHNFAWGAAFNAKDMIADSKHLDFFSGAFNIGVFENDLKIKFWNKEGRQERVFEAIDNLSARDVDLKGHVLIWPGFRHLTPAFKKNKGNPEKLESMIQEHLDDILKATKGKISRWDVVNETRANQDLQRITGSEEILFNGFRELHRRDPQVLRYTNEYGIINRGGLNVKNREEYYNYIKRMDENTGGLVDGIGIQSHIGSDLTPIEKVLEILDYYATLDKKISISEFTMDIKDPEVRTAYTGDFMTAAFSHPQVFEFLFWGYQTEKADIFTENWNAGSMGDACLLYTSPSPRDS